MCGFLAEFSLQKNLLSSFEFKELLSLSNKRGPDSHGYWTDGNQVQFGFNRLAILDLSPAGQQPMTSFSGRYTIVFNGEIYNHLQLRKRTNFNQFIGTSDTETILACVEAYGVKKSIELLDGMFAISIYDHKENTITLARDFAGIKPLFYGWDGKTLVAASQFDQIRKHPVYRTKSINSSVLKLYLKQHFLPAPFGLYEQTFQVLPGEMITFDLNGSKNHYRYWEFPARDNHTISDKKEAQQFILENLEECVNDQMLSDVPLGAFMSGGVDSPLICSLAKKKDPNLKVFSIGSDSKVHDESERATQFANALNLEQKLWKLDASEVAKYWDEVMSVMHEPLADFSIVPTYLVSKLAKKDVTVALSGDGGDELFFGYERFWSIAKNISYSHYPSIVKKGIYGANKYLVKSNKVNSILLAKSQKDAHEELHCRFQKKWLDIIAPDLINVELPNEWNVYNYDDTLSERQLIANIRKAEFYGMMQKTLRKVDLASMGNSLEVRVPFLQKKMIEASLKIDPFLSYGNGKQKEILKSLLHQQIPSVEREKVKKGFSVPLTKWIKTDLKDNFSEKLFEKSKLNDYGFDIKAVESMFDSHLLEKEDLKWPIFTLYALLK